jgi:hypothetical protein
MNGELFTVSVEKLRLLVEVDGARNPTSFAGDAGRSAIRIDA